MTDAGGAIGVLIVTWNRWEMADRVLAALAPALRAQLAVDGPTLLLVETQPESGPPAPRIPYTPPEMTARVSRAVARLAAVAGKGAR